MQSAMSALRLKKRLRNLLLRWTSRSLLLVMEEWMDENPAVGSLTRYE